MTSGAFYLLFKQIAALRADLLSFKFLLPKMQLAN
jgi:hypothetical protein